MHLSAALEALAVQRCSGPWSVAVPGLQRSAEFILGPREALHPKGAAPHPENNQSCSMPRAIVRLAAARCSGRICDDTSLIAVASTAASSVKPRIGIMSG